MSLAVVAVVGGGAYFYFTGGRYQSTDDAYAQAATVSISANVAGRVSEIDVRDNEFVHRGATLFRLDRRLRRLGVSRVGWLTIAAAMQARSPLSQSILADGLAVSRASMVLTIDRLVKNGLVKRESSASDRRLKRVVVTEAGAHLYSLLRDEVAAVRRQVLDVVELEKLVHLTELLEKLQERLRPRKTNN
jgi:MarR family transcriptional regulator for hemolysin